MAQQRGQQHGTDPQIQSQRLREARARIDAIDEEVRTLLAERKAALDDMRARLAACKHLDIAVDAEAEMLAADPSLDDVMSLLAPPPPSFRSEALRYLKSLEAEGATAAEIHRHVEQKIGRAFGRTTAPTTLLRLISSGEVKRDGERYFAVVEQGHDPEGALARQENAPDPGRAAGRDVVVPKAASPSEVKVAARRVLCRHEAPLRARELLAELQKEGIRVSGANPLNSLQTTLGHSKGEFVNLQGLGYWPADTAYAPLITNRQSGDGSSIAGASNK